MTDKKPSTLDGMGQPIISLGVGFSPSIFDGGSDARTALDDAVRDGNNPDRCTFTGSDV